MSPAIPIPIEIKNGCPFKLSIISNLASKDCIERKCAIWVKEKKECALLVLAKK